MAKQTGRVTGLGGVFLETSNKAELLDFYQRRLGMQTADFGAVFQWREKDQQEEVGYTVLGTFAEGGDYFEPSTAPFMLNFRVEGLDALLASLREAGVTIVGEPKDEPNGRFAWILDPEGRKVELWEPVPSAEDPYLG